MLSKRQSYAVRQIALLDRFIALQRATRTDPETAAEKPGYPILYLRVRLGLLRGGSPWHPLPCATGHR